MSVSVAVSDLLLSSVVLENQKSIENVSDLSVTRMDTTRMGVTRMDVARMDDFDVLDSENHDFAR